MNFVDPGEAPRPSSESAAAVPRASSGPVPYEKPRLEVIGTVRELTHVPKSPDPGDQPMNHLSGVL